jgi:ADP-ribose pyrophosphatase YjhB (NUDIX family)
MNSISNKPSLGLTDNLAYRFPVSIKGVILKDSKVILLKNERDEWELPGGKLEIGESPEICLSREIVEELDVNVRVGTILDSWVYEIQKNVVVVIITYGCYLQDKNDLSCSSEHKEVGTFDQATISTLNMPNGYKSSIEKWFSIFNN